MTKNDDNTWTNDNPEPAVVLPDYVNPWSKTHADIASVVAEMEEHQAEARCRNADACEQEMRNEFLEKTLDFSKNKEFYEQEVARIEYETEVAKQRITEFELDREEERRKAELSTDFMNRIYRFTDDIDESSVRKCMSTINYWYYDKVDVPCEIVFNSDGGDLSGFPLYDFIRDKVYQGMPIITTAMGVCASMASILLQAGSTREMTAESYILIHQMQGFNLGTMGDMEDKMDWYNKMMDRTAEIYACRSKLTTEKVKENWNRKQWWITSEEALEMGLVDRVRGLSCADSDSK